MRRLIAFGALVLAGSFTMLEAGRAEPMLGRFTLTPTAGHYSLRFEVGDDRIEFQFPRDKSLPVALVAGDRRLTLSARFEANLTKGEVAIEDEATLIDAALSLSGQGGWLLGGLARHLKPGETRELFESWVTGQGQGGSRDPLCDQVQSDALVSFVGAQLGVVAVAVACPTAWNPISAVGCAVGLVSVGLGTYGAVSGAQAYDTYCQDTGPGCPDGSVRLPDGSCPESCPDGTVPGPEGCQEPCPDGTPPGPEGCLCADGEPQGPEGCDRCQVTCPDGAPPEPDCTCPDSCQSGECPNVT